MQTWKLLRLVAFVALGSVVVSTTRIPLDLCGPAAAAPPAPDPRSALHELRTGVRRFVNSRRTRSTDTRRDADERHRTARGQHPFAAILCCADSRVCPELIFDQGVGSIFEVRNAGNVVDEDVLASVEYAIEHLHVPLVVVLGHKRCGAIEAVCKAGGGRLPHHLRALQTHMPGIRRQVIARNHRHDVATVNRLAQENARQQALTLRARIPALKATGARGTPRVACGMYDIETGAMEFFDLHSPAGTIH